MTPAEPTQEQVEAAWQALIEAGWESPYMARIRNFTREEVLAGKLREADEEADRKNLEGVRRALVAAFDAGRPR